MRKLLSHCLLFCLCGLFSAAALAADGRRLVLVSRLDSNIAPLTAPEVRRLYLGVPLFVNGKPVQPLRNTSDPVIEEAFLQKVLFMSRESYERALLSKVLHSGGTRPTTYTSENPLLQTIENNPNAVTYIWFDAISGKSLKILAELWQN